MDSRGARGAVRDPQAGCPAWRTADRPRGCGAGVSCGGGPSSVLLGSPGTVGEASHWTPTGPSRCRECPGPSCSWTQGQGLGPSVWARDGAGLWGRFSGNREGDVVGPALCPLSWEPSQSQADRDRWSRGEGAPVWGETAHRAMCSLDTGRQHLNRRALPRGGEWGCSFIPGRRGT